MKIKVKKEMRLDELIKWARENPSYQRAKNFMKQMKVLERYIFKKIQINFLL